MRGITRTTSRRKNNGPIIHKTQRGNLMSVVQSNVKCPQCEFVEADSCFDCRARTNEVMCRRCGYTEHDGPVLDESGVCGWKNEAKYGAGALWCRGTDGNGVFASYYLGSVKAVTEAEKWLRECLAAGEVDPTDSYLTRWNKVAKRIELVLGSFYIWPKDPESSQDIQSLHEIDSL